MTPNRLERQDGAQAKADAAEAAADTYADGAVATHSADTTSVHGITDTSALYRAGGIDIAVADGGTGASTASGARTNLGLGTAAVAATGDFDAAGAAATAQAASQPVDSDLTAIALLSTTSYGRSVLEAANAAALRTLAGLGSAATASASDFDATGSAAAAQAASQPIDSDLTAIAALTTTSFGRAFLALADAAAGRTALGLGTLATQSGTFSGTSSGTNTGDQDLSGLQPIDADLTAVAGLDSSTSGAIASDGAGWIKKTYAQFKTALSLVKGDVGLGNVDNTADASKPVSTAQQTALDAKVTANGGITGATKTKVTYDAKGLVTAGADATTADIADSTNKRYVTDAELAVLAVTSGTNTGDQTMVSGNAGTATALQTPRNIEGQAFDGTVAITVIAPGTHAATSKATPVDADELPLVDSAASNVLKKLTWANLKATLKTYFDTLYDATGAAASAITTAESYSDGALATHSADTTAVHGLTDTSALVVTTDARLSDTRPSQFSSTVDITIPDKSILTVDDYYEIGGTQVTEISSSGGVLYVDSDVYARVFDIGLDSSGGFLEIALT